MKRFLTMVSPYFLNNEIISTNFNDNGLFFKVVIDITRQIESKETSTFPLSLVYN